MRFDYRVDFIRFTFDIEELKVLFYKTRQKGLGIEEIKYMKNKYGIEIPCPSDWCNPDKEDIIFYKEFFAFLMRKEYNLDVEVLFRRENELNERIIEKKQSNKVLIVLQHIKNTYYYTLEVPGRVSTRIFDHLLRQDGKTLQELYENGGVLMHFALGISRLDFRIQVEVSPKRSEEVFKLAEEFLEYQKQKYYPYSEKGNLSLNRHKLFGSPTISYGAESAKTKVSLHSEMEFYYAEEATNTSGDPSFIFDILIFS